MNTVKSSTSGKFCKVCKDAGRTEAEYTSHFTRATRDIKSAVICPTLLANVCRYCDKTGHTNKFCPKKIRDAKQSEKHMRTREFLARDNGINKTQTVTSISTNRFKMLETEEDDDTEEEKEDKVERKQTQMANSKKMKSWCDYDDDSSEDEA
jgi:hypothetical protein